MFEYNTYLHHSQTHNQKLMEITMFEYHTYLHHSQTMSWIVRITDVFEYHTYLHHSQTEEKWKFTTQCLNTIHIYIILKLCL